MKAEAEGLLCRTTSACEEAAEDIAKAKEHEDVSGISDEVAKLQGLVGDVQRQLGQNHEDVRGWVGAVDTRLKDIIDADAGAMKKIDFLVTMLMAVRGEGFDTPRYACVLPPWPFEKDHGLSEGEQNPKVWVELLKEWQQDDFKEGKGFLKKEKRLFLVCAHTHRLVPCGPDGHGYDIQQPRTWFRRTVRVATFALQVLCATLTAMAAVPLSGAGAAVEAGVSAAMGNFESMLQQQLEGLSLDDDDDAEVGVGSKVGRCTWQLTTVRYRFQRYVCMLC